MEQIKHFVLPAHTNMLYEKEAISSIYLTKDIAEKINELIDCYNELVKGNLAKDQEQDGRINKAVIFMKDNLINSTHDLFKLLKDSGDIDSIVGDVLLDLNTKINGMFDSRVMSVKEYGAYGDGINDDTNAIQKAIDEANKGYGRVRIPKGTYVISKPLVLNGCTLEGDPGNVFHDKGSVILCRSKDFTAIKQGSTDTKDIMFNIKDLLIKNADVGIELNYVVNSVYENLYFTDCNTGMVLGSGDTVGSMFNHFNNLYMDNCEVGIISNSNQYFNNNVFNNGFIQGNTCSMQLKVTGGYGAVNNTFNNVEFRSKNGRGIELDNAINTIFNHCYFECGGNAIRTTNYCTVDLNGCVYGLYKKENTNGDVNVVYATGGFRAKFDDGVIFLTDEYANRVFFGATNEAVYANIHMFKPINKIGSATGFTFFSKSVLELETKKEEAVVITNTIVAKANTYTQVPFVYTKEFTSIPNVLVVTMRSGAGVIAGLTYAVTDRTKNGGVIEVYNDTSSDKSISFSIYAKLMEV